MYRRNLGHSRVKNLCKFASQKNSHSCLVESTLEFDACFHFEYSEQVLSFEAQPEGFMYPFNGQFYPYTPDFLLILKSGKRQFIEVKLLSKINDEELKNRFQAKRQTASDLGIDLILVTESQIRATPLLENLKLIDRYSGLMALTAFQKIVQDYFSTSGSQSIAFAANALEADAQEVFLSVLRLCALGVIRIKMDKPLSIDSLVWCSYD